MAWSPSTLPPLERMNFLILTITTKTTHLVCYVTINSIKTPTTYKTPKTRELALQAFIIVIVMSHLFGEAMKLIISRMIGILPVFNNKRQLQIRRILYNVGFDVKKMGNDLPWKSCEGKYRCKNYSFWFGHYLFLSLFSALSLP